MAGLAAALLLVRAASAQEAPAQLMSEPTGYTSVADAFDEGDVLDVDVQLGFRRSVSSSSIQREHIDLGSQDGRSRRHLTGVAHHEHIRNELRLQLDVGIFHDLMLFVRLPLVLGDDRVLEPTGAGCMDNDSESCQALLEPTASGGDAPLFDLSMPLHSARRSGLPSIDLGAAWGVINQYRKPYLATWVVIAEVSIDTGSVMSPCLDEDCEPGVSSGTAKLKIESRWSYRYRYLEPFFGIGHTFVWLTGAELLYRPEGELAGAVDDEPPARSEGTLGVAVIPWEDRGRFQRFEVDVSGNAALTTSGRDVSPLFDALGRSDNEHIRAPNYASLPATPPVEDVPFTGLTNVESHAQLALDAEIVMQAARYVRFSLGLGVAYQTPHLITGAPACNPEVEPRANDPRVGSCQQGILNPLYRPAIDAPGKRFRQDDEITVRLLASAIGQF